MHYDGGSNLLEIIMVALFVWLSAISAILSAVFWIASTLVVVKHVDRYDADGDPVGSLSDGSGNDLVLTARRQSRVGATAAICAACAAAFHAIALILGATILK